MPSPVSEKVICTAPFTFFGCDGQTTSVGHRFLGVVGEVQKDALQLFSVCHDRLNV